MNRKISRRKLQAIQKDLWLAEIVRESEDALLVTLAGDGRVLAFDCQGISALAIAQEALDPWTMPAELAIVRPFALADVLDFEPEDEIAARLREVSSDELVDLLAASRCDWLLGSPEQAAAAPFLLDLRVENWGPEEERTDLHVIIAARDFLAVADDEIDLAPGADEGQKADAGTIVVYEPPPAPAWEVAPHDLPAELERPLRAFFTAALEDDFETIARLWPVPEFEPEQRLLHLRRHFHQLEDWAYARRIDGRKREGDLAAVRVRGIAHSAPEVGIRALNEECVWTFSLRRRGGEWLIRGWSRGWPSVGGAERLPDEERPWLATWTGGPIEDD